MADVKLMTFVLDTKAKEWLAKQQNKSQTVRNLIHTQMELENAHPTIENLKTKIKETEFRVSQDNETLSLLQNKLIELLNQRKNKLEEAEKVELEELKGKTAEQAKEAKARKKKIFEHLRQPKPQELLKAFIDRATEGKDTDFGKAWDLLCDEGLVTVKPPTPAGKIITIGEADVKDFVRRRQK